MNIKVEVDGTVTPITPANGETYTLEELQGFVGGFIEIVHAWQDKDNYLIVNEEGHMRCLPFNTKVAEVTGFAGIAGTAVIVPRSTIK